MPDAIETWCPQCGPGVPSDDGGCCGMCGATCTGPGAGQALDSVKRIAELERMYNVATQPALGGLKDLGDVPFVLMSQWLETRDVEKRAEREKLAEKDARIAELENRVAELEREAKAVVSYLRLAAGAEFCLVDSDGKKI